MAQKYLRSGEFAKLCGTTKDTLFHYDDIGLLKPAKIGGNGYRYYSVNQMMLFDIISLFKEVGMNLTEIKAYIDERNTENFIARLKEKDRKIHEEIERLKRLRNLLRNTINLTQNAFNVEIDKIKFVDMAEEYFIVTSGETNIDDKSVFEAIFKHMDYCTKHNFYYTFTLGEIIGEQSIANKTYKTTYYSTKINRIVKNKHLLIKPAGKYAIKYIRGSYYDLPREYGIFCEQLEAMNYKIVGNIYQEDLLNYLSQEDFKSYLMKMEVRVS